MQPGFNRFQFVLPQVLRALLLLTSDATRHIEEGPGRLHLHDTLLRALDIGLFWRAPLAQMTIPHPIV